MLNHVRMAAAATAVCGVILGISQVTPDPDAADVMVMMPTGEVVLRALGEGEALPFVPTEQDQPTLPRQVAGPVPLTPPAASNPAAAPAAPAAASPALVAGSRGIPAAVLAAYQKAAGTMSVEQPSCHLTWPILAGIGRIESGHARGGDVDAYGTTNSRIVGPALDGAGNFALIRDSDDGEWDGDTTYDRAVGPMQFLPGTWLGSGRDGNGDGKSDPNNVVDAALASATYLCSGGGDMFARDDLLGAVFRYNRSWEYVSNVLTWAGVYASAGPVVTAGGPAPGSKDPVVIAKPKPSTKPEPSSTPKPKPSSVPKPTPSRTPTPAPSTPTLASLGGRVLDDASRPVGGVLLTLTGAASATARSAADGSFVLSDLPPGEYVVKVGAAEGYAAPAATTVTLRAGRHLGDLTLSQVTAALSGRVFTDTDADGTDDESEVGVAAATVRLTGTDVRGQAVDMSVATDETGKFSFAGLLAGTYAVSGPVLPLPVLGVLPIAPLGELLADGGIGTVPVGAGDQLTGFGFALGDLLPVL